MPDRARGIIGLDVRNQSSLDAFLSISFGIDRQARFSNQRLTQPSRPHANPHQHFPFEFNLSRSGGNIGRIEFIVSVYGRMGEGQIRFIIQNQVTTGQFPKESATLGFRKPFLILGSRRNWNFLIAAYRCLLVQGLLHSTWMTVGIDAFALPSNMLTNRFTFDRVKILGFLPLPAILSAGFPSSLRSRIL